MDTPPPIPVFQSAPPPPLPPAKSGGVKWAFVGCGGCLALVVVGGLVSAAIVWLTMGVIKKTDVYSEAFRRAQNSPQVQEALGKQLEAGWMFEGMVNYVNGEGTAKFSVPISGPKDEGRLVAEAEKKSGKAWLYSKLEVQVSGGETIDLRDAPEAPPADVP